MGELSVSSQKELVEKNFEAYLAQAIAESQKGKMRGLSIAFGVLGVLMLVGVALLWLYVQQPQIAPVKKPETYATRALKVALTRDRVREEDEVGHSPEVVNAKRELRDLLTECAESMPADPEGQRMLEQATEWYKEDVIQIWADCQSTAQMLAKAELPIHEEPRRILEGAIEVMQRLKIHPNKDQSIRSFGALYESYRKSAPRGERWSKQISHQEAIDWLVELQKFDE